MISATNPTYRLISNHGFAEVRQQNSNQQNALFSLRRFKSGEMVSDFYAGTIAAEPTYLTVQVDTGKHITLEPEFLQYINHSCAPNVFFDTTSYQVVALKDIAFDEEMTFFYPSTEWKMTQPFNCYCGTPSCLHNIQGAAFLNDDVIKKYRFTDFIKQQLAKNIARKVA